MSVDIDGTTYAGEAHRVVASPTCHPLSAYLPRGLPLGGLKVPQANCPSGLGEAKGSEQVPPRVVMTGLPPPLTQ